MMSVGMKFQKTGPNQTVPIGHQPPGAPGKGQISNPLLLEGLKGLMGLGLMRAPIQDGPYLLSPRLGLGLMGSGLSQLAWRHVAKPPVGLGHHQAHKAPHPQHKGAEEVVGHPYPTEARHFGFGHLGPSLMTNGVLVHRDPGMRGGDFIPFCPGGGLVEALHGLPGDSFETFSCPVGIQDGSPSGEEGHSYIADFPEMMGAAEAQPGQDHHRQRPLPGGQAGDGHGESYELNELEKAAPQEQQEPKAGVGAVTDDRWFFLCRALLELWGSPRLPLSLPDGTNLLVDVAQVAGGAAKPGGGGSLRDANSLEDEDRRPQQDTAVGGDCAEPPAGCGPRCVASR